MSDNGNRDAVQWGPEIAVEGVKPDWLTQNDVVRLKTGVGWTSVHTGRYDRVSSPIEDWAWTFRGGSANILAIALPADHPHYSQAVTRTTDEQLTHYAERCKALVIEMASQSGPKPRFIERARAIVASMVEVDGDVEIAREIERDHRGGNDREFRMCLAGIKKGRELALADQG